MCKKTKKLKGVAEMLAARFVETEIEVSNDLHEISDSYYEHCEANNEILHTHPKLLDSIILEDELDSLSSEEYKALVEFYHNGIMMDRERTLCLYFRAFADCVEYLKYIGAVEQSFMGMDFLDICKKYPSEFKSML